MHQPFARHRQPPVLVLRTVLLALACLLGMTGAAHAGTLTLTNDGTTFTATDTSSNDAPVFEPADGNSIHVHALGSVSPAAGCTLGAYWYTCDLGTASNFVLNMPDGVNGPTVTFCTGTMTFNLGNGTNNVILPGCFPSQRIVYHGGSGFDHVVVPAGNQAPMSISLGDGNDYLGANDDSTGPLTVDGGPGNDDLNGGGNDDSISGGDGNDALQGHGGNDVLDAGAGDDTLDYSGSTMDADPGSNVYFGGPGNDKLDFYGHQAGVTVSLDDVANDGGPGETGNVHSDIESINGSRFGDTIIGSANPEKITGDSGNDVLRGGGGDDTVTGGSGDDAIYGDAGNDTLQGSEGNDTLDGGSGRDSLTGDLGACSSASCPGGNDTILARDGEQDSVNCGLGADIAQVDSIDVLPTDFYSACESVDSSAALVTNPGITPGGAAGPGGSNASPATFTAAVTGKPSAAKGAGVNVSCVAACTITATLGVSKTTAKKYKLG
ncbi:MAG: calcium-binding protein, partial [Patulibacter sp.]|nr:calcium-binding protein [Patulibacter sp.]